MADTVVVVPCYNEAARLRVDAFRQSLADDARTDFLFVNDGSSDNTAAILSDFCATTAGRCRLLDLNPNLGKAEAVRQGLLAALDTPAPFVGFWDADLATPLPAIGELRQVLDATSSIDWVFGSRVQLLGRRIERLRSRHYLGRVWATGVSLMLGLPIYDTQCGAKLFRASDELRRVLAEPFITRWVFDVELIARLIVARRDGGAAVERAIYELPLREWRDVDGSKLRARDFWRSGFDLGRIYSHYFRGR